MPESSAEGAALPASVNGSASEDSKEVAAAAHAEYVLERAQAAVEACEGKVEAAEARLAAAKDALANAIAERDVLEGI